MGVHEPGEHSEVTHIDDCSVGGIDVRGDRNDRVAVDQDVAPQLTVVLVLAQDKRALPQSAGRGALVGRAVGVRGAHLSSSVPAPGTPMRYTRMSMASRE